MNHPNPDFKGCKANLLIGGRHAHYLNAQGKALCGTHSKSVYLTHSFKEEPTTSCQRCQKLAEKAATILVLKDGTVWAYQQVEASAAHLMRLWAGFETERKEPQ